MSVLSAELHLGIFLRAAFHFRAVKNKLEKMLTPSEINVLNLGSI